MDDEAFNDNDSWGSDFDDDKSEYYQEIQDNKINESLEAQLVKNTSANIAIGKAVTSCPEGGEIAAYSNVIAPSTVTKPVKGFSYLVNPNSVNVLRNSPNQNVERRNGAIPKRMIAPSGSNDVLQPVNESQPENNAHATVNAKAFVSGRPQTIENNFSQLGYSIPSVQQSRNSLPENSNTSATSVELITRNDGVTPSKTPGRLRPEAFSFLKTNMESTEESVTKKDELVNRLKKNIVSPTAFIHATKLINQNTPEIENVGSGMETYEWSLPSSSNLNTSEKNDNARLKILENTSTAHINNRPVTQETKPVKPPLPSRPPPVFMYQDKIFVPKNEKSIMEKTSASERIIEKYHSELSTTLASPVFFKNNFIQSEIKSPSTYIDSKNTNEKRTVQNIPINISNPLPVKPTSTYPPCVALTTFTASKITNEENVIQRIPKNTKLSEKPAPIYPPLKTPKVTSQKKENDLSLENSPSNIHIFQGVQLLVMTPQQTMEGRKEGKDFNHRESSSVEILSQKFVATPIVHAGKPQLPQRKSLDSSVRTDCELEEEFNCTRVARFLSTPQQDISNEESSRQKVNDFEQIRENTDPISNLDEIRLNAIHRPSLPQRLHPSQKSRSYSSLVQSLKEIGFVRKNQNDRSKHSSTDTIEKSPKDTVSKTDEKIQPIDVRKLSSGFSNAEDIHATDSKSQLWKNNVDCSSQKDILTRHAWFHDVDAKEAGRRLMSMHQDGAFLIRPSTHPTPEQPFTACVSFAGRVINLHIRHLTNGYALGKYKEGQKIFSTLSDMIKYHQDVPVEIRTVGQTNPGPSSTPSDTSYPPPFYARFLVTPPK